MARQCAYPGCEGQLTSNLPVDIILCGVHQADYLWVFLPKLNNEPIPDDVRMFIFLHPEGAYHEEFALAIGHKREYFRRARNRTFNFKRVLVSGHNRRFFDQEEMIRIAIEDLCWVPARWYADKIEADLETMLDFAKVGTFKETRENSYGALCIRVEWKEKLEEMKKLYRKKSKANSRRCNIRPLTLQGKFTAGDLGGLMGIGPAGPSQWMTKYPDDLPSVKVGKYRVVTGGKFLEFAIKVVTGKITGFKPKSVEKLRWLIQEVRKNLRTRRRRP